MVIYAPFLYRVDAVIAWKIYRFQLPLVFGGIRSGLLLQLVDENKQEKWGEIAPLPGRSQETIEQAFDQLVNLFSKGNVEKELFPSVQFGLESALQPVCRPLTAPLYAFLYGSPDEILRRAESAMNRGYTVAKVKIASFSKEVAIDLLQALKEWFRLRVDCNSAFSFKEAVDLFSHVDPSTFDYIEDPTYEISRLADFPFPFALDETVCDYRLLPMKSFSHFYGFILKPTILGGKKGCSPLIHFAQKHNLKVVFSPAFESGLGLLQILRLASHFNLLTDPLGLDTHRYLTHDLLLNSISFNTPKMTVTSSPEVNIDLLEEIAHGTSELPHL